MKNPTIKEPPFCDSQILLTKIELLSNDPPSRGKSCNMDRTYAGAFLETGFLRISLVASRRFLIETRFLCVSPDGEIFPQERAFIRRRAYRGEEVVAALIGASRRRQTPTNTPWTCTWSAGASIGGYLGLAGLRMTFSPRR